MVRLEMSRVSPNPKRPDVMWRVAVIIETDGVPGRKGTGAPVQLCSGSGSSKEEAAGWALHHLRRLSDEGSRLLRDFGAQAILVDAPESR